jgi:hypothetical protein
LSEPLGGGGDEPVRLYSKQKLVAADSVLPQHRAIHEDLDRWGSWLRERYDPVTCGSIEKKYEKGGRDATPPSTAPQPADPRLTAIDQVVRLMRMRVPQHAECLTRFYLQRAEPAELCRRIAIHPRDFPRFMGHCRSMVLNILRELAS